MVSKIKAEVRNAEQAHLDAARRGDAVGLASHFHPDMDVFWHDGRSLIQAPECQVALRMPFEQGFKMDFRYYNLEIRLITDAVAVPTGYLGGTIQRLNSNEFDMGYRLTGIRVKEGDEWKIIHWYESPIQSGA